MRVRRFVIGLAAAMCLAGCTSGSDEPPKAKPTKSTISADDASAMKEGRDYDVVATLPAKIRGLRPWYFGVSPDGIVYGATFAEDPDAEQNVGPGGMRITTRSNVILVDPGSGKVTRVSDGHTRSRPNGIQGIDVNEDWVTWLEVLDGAGKAEQPWRLYSYDRSTGTERLLGSGALKGDIGMDNRAGPAINGDRVVISTVTYGDRTGKTDQVLNAPLDGSAPVTELVGGATAADADPEGISYTIRGTATLMFRDAASGKTKVIDDGKSECRTYHSGVLVTCSPYGAGTKFWVRPKRGTVTAFGPFAGDVGYNDQEKGWTTFVTDSDGDATLYAIDTDRMKLFKVADAQGGWQLMGNDMALVSPFNGAKGDITLIKLR